MPVEQSTLKRVELKNESTDPWSKFMSYGQRTLGLQVPGVVKEWRDGKRTPDGHNP